jgi:penicillin-binding protein 1C
MEKRRKKRVTSARPPSPIPVVESPLEQPPTYIAEPVTSREEPRVTNKLFFHHVSPRIRMVLLAIPLLCIALFYFLILKDLPSPKQLTTEGPGSATKIFDRNGTLLFDIFAEQNRTPVPLKDIPLQLRQATIAVEDKDFYKHKGVNPIGGILRAITASIFKQQLQGGSTITQQLVKTALLSPERTVTRKVKEIILAYWVEFTYSKDQILEMYLNRVPYGGTAWGVEAAAEKYFGKPVKDLTLAESALLAGLPQAPSLYSPFGSRPDLAFTRQHDVLTRMVAEKYISRNDGDAAKKQSITFAKPSSIKAPHFVMYVKELLVEKYGLSTVERGGLRVTTTLDLPLQEYAQATVAAEIDTVKDFNITNGAALITKPATGEILAMVGSTDYFATPSGSYNVTTAYRQPGSSIKPINYGIGIDRHLVTAGTMFLDVPTCFGVQNQSNYCPKNYDWKFHGPVQLRFALGNSYNIPAVKMMMMNTVTDMVASASAFGIESYKDPSKYGLSLTLGGGEVKMTEMATAFGVYANGGIRKNLVSILKVTDKQGKTLEEYKDPNLNRAIPSQLLLNGPRVVSTETAFIMSHILLDNNARQDAFGPASSLVIPGHAVSVKTGTTDDLRDNWTIGFTPQVLVAVWVGNNNNTVMSRLTSGVTGAAPIWNKLMKYALIGKPDIWPKQPDGVIGKEICSVSGLLPPTPDAPDKGCPIRFEYFIKGTEPTMADHAKQNVAIDKSTGDLAKPGQTDNIEMQDHMILKDPVSQYCIDCQHPGDKPVFIPY